jgi:hypothetical protein
MEDALNEELDLYFNLFYAGLGSAFEHGFERIGLGQTGEGFKSRLGGVASPLYVYLKGRGWLTGPLIRYATPLLAPKQAGVPEHNVFRAKDGS